MDVNPPEQLEVSPTMRSHGADNGVLLIGGPAPMPGSRRGSGYCRQFKHEDNTFFLRMQQETLGSLDLCQ